jgi:hypothetical protein
MGRQAIAAAALLWLGLNVSALEAEAVQIELDRIVSRAGGHIITQSDIRRARALRLVDDVSSDQAVQRALETRLLILSELDRAAPLGGITPADVAARRAEWAASLGGSDRIGALLAPNGMTEGELEAWLRDDLRIRAYLNRQFGMLPQGDRQRAVDEWIARLRQRAELR